MIRTWKCLLGTIAVCALLAGDSRAQEIRANQDGVVHLRSDEPLNETQPADSLYGAQESVWLNDFQPPPGVGVDPVTVPQDNNLGYAVTSNVDSILYGVSRYNRHYYGLDDGFTSVNAFIPLRVMNGGTSLLAVAPRAFVNDDGQGGINFGVTARRYFPSTDRLLSTSLWIDYDDGHYGGYGQFGLYGAIVGRYLTTSAFANIPFGEKENVLASTLSSTFANDGLALTRSSLVESPYAHYQVEFTTPIPYFSRFGFQYGLGAYALASRADSLDDGFGVSNRIQAQVTEDLTVSTLVTSDGVFGSNMSINLELTLPNGLPSRLLRLKSVRSHLTSSDLRSYRVLTDVARQVEHVAAINPKDGQRYTVAHINPNVFGGGTGVNDPFGSVQQFESLPDGVQSEYDIIFVHRRADDTDTNLDTTITLFDCQQLLGDGVTHFVDSTFGPIPLPMTSGPLPLMSNARAPGMDVVRLADENVVAGLSFDSTGGTGDPMDPDAAAAISGLFGANPNETGADAGVRDFNINNNNFANVRNGVVIDVEQTMLVEDMFGLFIANTSESVGEDVLNISYEGTGAPSDTLHLVINDNQLAGIGRDGIAINFSGSAVGTLDMLRNAISPGGGGGGNIFLTGHDVVSHFGQLGLDMVMINFIRDMGLPSEIPENQYDLAVISTGSIGGQWSNGMQTIPTLGSYTFYDTNQLIANPGMWNQVFQADGIYIIASLQATGAIDDPGIDAIIAQAPQFASFLGNGGDIVAEAGGTRLDFYTFLPPSAAAAGMPIAAITGFVPTPAGAAIGITDVMINGNLTHNTFDNFSPVFTVMEQLVSGTMTQDISIGARNVRVAGGGLISGGGRHGVAINTSGTSFLDASSTISDNIITGFAQNGLSFVAGGSSTLLVDGDRNLVRFSGENGLLMASSGTARLDVAFRNSIFDDNGGRGVKGAAEDASTMSFSLTSPFDPLATEDRNRNGMLDPGEDLNGNGMIDPLRSSASNNGGPGIEFLGTDDAVLGEDTNFDGVLDLAEDINANGILDPGILIDDVLVNGNTDAGILVSVTNSSGLAGGAYADVHITNSDITNTVDGPDPDLNGDGIVLRSAETGVLQALIMDNVTTIDGNAGHGISLFATEDSIMDLSTATGHGIINNTITNNGLSAINVERRGSADLDVDIIDVVATGNDTGLSVTTDGGNVDSVPNTRVSVLRGEYSGNTDDGMRFDSFGSSILLVDVIGAVINGNGDNGVMVTTNDGSFFGMPDPAGIGIGFPSVFDSVQVTENGDNGFLLTNNNLSTLVIDITSIEAAIDPTMFERTVIADNAVDGIHAIHNGGAIVGDFSLTSIRVGTAFAFPDPDIFEVEIVENGDDAVDIDINPGSSGVFNINISDTLLRGGRAIGALVDPGISITHDSSFNVATVVVGSDISDAMGPFGLPRGPIRDAVGGVFDNTPYARAGSVITDFAGDGINIVYSNSDSTGSELNLRLFDSVIGQSVFGFNTGDGLDITVDNAGDPSGFSGFDAIVDNTSISGNGGHGIFLRSVADTGGLFSDGVDGLDGALLELSPFEQTDSNSPPNGIGDTIVDGPPYPNGDSTSDDFLNSLAFVLDPAGANNGWADLTSPDDFIVDLQIINGSRIDFNGMDGVHLEIGTATRQRLSMQNSSFSGNGDFELNILTFASFEPDNDDIDRAEGMFDRIGLDPTAKLDLFMGSLDFVRNTPAGFPEPGPPVPAEFSVAIGGEGFNTSDSTRVLIDYVSPTAVGFQNASTFKGSPRPANLFVRALIPEDAPLIDDIDIPLPNRFLNFGQPFDETLFFLGNLPASTFPDRYLDLNTP